MSRELVFWIKEISIEFLDQGHNNVVIWLLGQGPMPPTPLELLSELVVLSNLQLNIPLWEDVSGMDILLVSLPCDLRNEP